NDTNPNRRPESVGRSGKSSDHNQAPADAEGDSLRTAGPPEFSKDRTDMKFNGVLGNGEFGCDLLVTQPCGYHTQDFDLSRGEDLIGRIEFGSLWDWRQKRIKRGRVEYH